MFNIINSLMPRMGGQLGSGFGQGAGMVLGGAFGGPLGAMLGSQIGGSLGALFGQTLGRQAAGMNQLMQSLMPFGGGMGGMGGFGGLGAMGNIQSTQQGLMGPHNEWSQGFQYNNMAQILQARMNWDMSLRKTYAAFSS